VKETAAGLGYGRIDNRSTAAWSVGEDQFNEY
jgi:hypothetical protein